MALSRMDLYVRVPWPRSRGCELSLARRSPGMGGKDTGSAGGPPASIASTTVATTLTRLPRGQAGEPPVPSPTRGTGGTPALPGLLRAYDFSQDLGGTRMEDC